MTDAAATDEHRVALDLLIHGFQVSRMLRLAADLAIADRIAPDGSRHIRDLAADCSVLTMPLLRVVRALAAFDIFRVTAGGVVTHSPRSLLLRTDAPGSLRYSARFWAGPGSWRAWGALDEALVGRVPYETVWNTSRFDYLSEHPDEARVFDAFMAHSPDDPHHAVANGYDFSGAALIADIGGGNGEMLRRILARFPTPRGVVFDREHVVAAIPATARADGRLDVIAGSFFDEIPPGADLYLLVRVLHDWSDPLCIEVLRNVRAAMSPSARLLIVEAMLEPDPALADPSGYLMDMQMMAMFGTGRERTEAEYGGLLGQSGFAALGLTATASPVSIITAAPR